MTVHCDRCDEKITEPWHTGAFGYKHLCATCYEDCRTD